LRRTVGSSLVARKAGPTPRPLQGSLSRDRARRTDENELGWLASLFLVGLVIPWIISVGSLNLSIYRLVLLVTLLPCLLLWVSGRAGAIRIADLGVLAYCAWAAASLINASGVDDAIQPAGILFVETSGAYFLARCFIKSRSNFDGMITLATKIVIVLSPFAVYEFLSGTKPILEAFALVFPTVDASTMPRMGLWRVQGPFPHSIAFGLFCGSIYALACLTGGEGRGTVRRRLLSALVAGTTFLSLSSAAVAGLALQGALMAWNWLLKQYRSRWKLLWALLIVAYLIILFGSTRTPIKFYISHFTFNAQTAWFRILIWDYASASVLNHPFFGIGFADWQRPKWLFRDSIDNFWLVTAVRYGIPALAFLLLACLSIVISVARSDQRTDGLKEYRVAYLICISAYFVVGTTVHFWGATYVWFMFLLGSGVWLLDAGTSEDGGSAQGECRQDVGRSRHPAGPSAPNKFSSFARGTTVHTQTD
jgi:O-antigen ligase